jgi:hypothetical protein
MISALSFPTELCYTGNKFFQRANAMTTIEKITEKLDEIASRAGTRRRDVGQLVAALRVAVSTITRLGAPAPRMTTRERLKMCDDAIEQVARHLI